jgi:hypothetical protein
MRNYFLDIAKEKENKTEKKETQFTFTFSDTKSVQVTMDDTINTIKDKK